MASTILNNSNEIYKKVKDETGKSDFELNEQLNKIKEKYQGLLSDVGANIMLAKLLGVNLDLKKTNSFLKISEINGSIDGVSLYARVKSISPIKKFVGKDGSPGVIQAIYLGDETGLIKLNLWHDKASLVQELNLDKNSLLLIKDAYVSVYNDKPELSLRQGGSINLEEDEKRVPKIIENYIPLSEIIQAHETLIDTTGRIINIYPEKAFADKDGKPRKLISFEISDGKRTIRCVSFDTHVDFIKTNLSKGDIIKLCDVRVKDGLYDQEININWNSTLIKNPSKLREEIPLLKDMISNKMEKGEIGSILENKPYILEGMIVSVNRNKIRFFKCPECNEKIQPIENDFICEKCNKAILNPIINLFGSLDIDDGTGLIKLVFFNDIATRLYNLKPELLKKELTEEEKNEIFENLEANLVGKKVSVTGKGRMNNFSGKIEFICDTLEMV